MKKGTVLLVIFLVLVIGFFGIILIDNFIGSDQTLDNYTSDESTSSVNQEDEGIETNGAFKVYIDHMRSGGPPKDGIPPIEDPKYISVQDADEYLEDEDKVFVYEADEGIFMYPQRILVWHEIVNENIDGENISITYCPLTGSTICYLGQVGTYENNTYGTSGKLLNSNLVMYDRATGSYIPQILGIGINNALEGVTLQTKPIHWANWEDAKSKYPEARVLSTDTGFLRDYYADPYGTYHPDDERSYYLSGGPIFPLMHENDGPFRDKKIVVGVKYMDQTVAIDPFLARDRIVMNFEIENIQAVAFYDSSLKTVRIFQARLGDETLTFEYLNGKIMDQRGIQWFENGISENGETLEAMTYFDVMWFAWHGFYPDTKVIR